MYRTSEFMTMVHSWPFIGIMIHFFVLSLHFLRTVVVRYGLFRYLLLGSQLVIVLISFSVAVECKAATLTQPDLCLSHIRNYSEHEHSHLQSVAILPLTVELAA
jgi:hypothetical protein